MQFAPRIPGGVRKEIERLASGHLTAAQITRLVGTQAEELGFRRPSYQQVRAIVRGRRTRPKSGATAAFLIDFVYRPSLVYHRWGSCTAYDNK